MILISLNTWSCRAGKDKMSAFLDSNKKVDIFCLQEVFDCDEKSKNDPFVIDDLSSSKEEKMEIELDQYASTSSKLPGFNGLFCPIYKKIYGIAMFIDKSIKVSQIGEIVLYQNNNFPDPKNENADMSRKAQWVEIEKDGKKYTIVNIHGHWDPKGKMDTEERLKQSRLIVDLISHIKTPVIICGDFNLLPHTESVKIIENAGMRNLIKEFGITSTRTAYYEHVDKFADYCFVSKDIKVKEFKVLPDEVSDHSPLYLDFE